MQRVHDRGGWPDVGPIDKSEHDYSMWEKRTDALMRLLISDEKQIMTMDEVRRAIECIKPGAYEKLKYYERWIVAIETLMIEKEILAHQEIDHKVKALERQMAGSPRPSACSRREKQYGGEIQTRG